ncbi:nucleoporin Nup85-like protein [Dichotomocladium elegans]|nr:nucleoporin Nup85-like protein [Dichotomocladium elegans]
MHNTESLELFYQISTIPKEQLYKPRLKSQSPDRTYDSCDCVLLDPEEIHRVSQMYIDLLSSYFHTLISSKEGSRDYIERRKIQHIIAVWELADIMFFSTHPQETTSPKIMTWLNRVDKSFMKYDTQGIFSSASPAKHDEFWPMVYKLALRRMIPEVQRVVDAARSRDNEANGILSYLLEAIEHFPIIPDRLDSTKVAKFKAEERTWYEQVKSVVSMLDGSTPPQHSAWEKHHGPIMDVIKILQGDGATIVKHADTPIEAMVALAVYSDPLATTEGIRNLVGSVILAPEVA